MVVEKPFGTDHATSTRLNAAIERVFPPDSIYRIDHYLGNRHIDHVQIMAESDGVAGRVGYYEGVGAVRDVVQNHLLQLLALIAMEEPVIFDAAGIAAEKAKVLSATSLVEPFALTCARGRYGLVGEQLVPGLLDEDGFPSDSTTETFAALTLNISTRRWAGVPFYIRTGKRMPCRKTEIAVVFAPPPRRDSTAPLDPAPNTLVFRVQPDEGIELHIGMKEPGAGSVVRQVSLSVDFDSVFDAAPEAYERLIHDVLCWDSTLFPRREEIEQSWRVIDPLLRYWAMLGDQPEEYPAGTAGPSGADRLTALAERSWRTM